MNTVSHYDTKVLAAQVDDLRAKLNMATRDAKFHKERADGNFFALQTLRESLEHDRITGTTEVEVEWGLIGSAVVTVALDEDDAIVGVFHAGADITSLFDCLSPNDQRVLCALAYGALEDKAQASRDQRSIDAYEHREVA